MNEAFLQRTLDELRAEIAAAEAEEAEIQQEMQAVQARLHAVQLRLRELRRAGSSFARLLGELTQESSESDAWTEGDSPVRHADIAEQVLRETEHALRVPEIGQRMLQKGHPLPADERLRDSAIFAAMKRRPHVFERVARGLWALKEWGREPSRVQHALDFKGGDPVQEGPESG